MCLSTVYKNKLTPETVMMRNVMKIECRDGMVILTDLMERQMAVEGTLEMANLVDGVAVVKENIPALSPSPKADGLWGRFSVGFCKNKEFLTSPKRLPKDAVV